MRGGERAFSTVLNLGVGGGSTSVHLILWCSLTHKSAHFSFFFCFFFVFFFFNAGCTKQEDLSLCFKPCGFFISLYR